MFWVFSKQLLKPQISSMKWIRLVHQNPPKITKLRNTRQTKQVSMMSHIKGTMKAHPEAVVLTQVGSFFEMYAEQALEWGPRLGLRVARKKHQRRTSSTKDTENWINMSGFPTYQLEKYLKLLVQDMGKTVVLLEQDNKAVAKSGSEQAKRPVSQIFTPGTVISESLVNANKSNYLLTIAFNQTHLIDTIKSRAKSSETAALDMETHVGLSWADVSDGFLYYQDTTLGNLLDDLLRIRPVEIVVDKAINNLFTAHPELFSFLELERFRITSCTFPASDGVGSLRPQSSKFLCSKASLHHCIDSLSHRCQLAVSALVEYASTNLPGSMIKFELPEVYNRDSTVIIDRHTITGLEIFSSSARSGSVRGSLFNVLNETATAGGTKLLAKRLTSPSRDMALIKERLDKVEFFTHERELRQNLENELREMPDGKRNLQKLAMRKLNPMELLVYAKTVECLTDLHKRLSNYDEPETREWTEALRNCIAESLAIANDINDALDLSVLMGAEPDVEETMESSPVNVIVKEGRTTSLYKPIIKPSYSEKIAEIRKRESTFYDVAKTVLERAKQLSTKPSAVKLRWSPQFSYHILYQNPMPDSIDPSRILRQTKNTMVVLDPELSAAGRAHESFYSAIEEAETEIIESFRDRALQTMKQMRTGLEAVDEIDVTQALSKLALTMKLTRPVLCDNSELKITGGRHIVVERALLQQGQSFTTNDCVLTDSKPLSMITGPNMGGKSTFIRQNAIICLLAHIGSFVPAEHAEIGILDRLMCRIGSGDDLFRGRSTFMMEMLETSHILRNATSKTLAILDEVGRGTSRDDGIAIAYATIKHMIEHNQCKALFATHYGSELSQVFKDSHLGKKIRPLKSQIALTPSDLRFVHKLVEGVSKSSHGILIAGLAGFPELAIHDAEQLHVPEFEVPALA